MHIPRFDHEIFSENAAASRGCSFLCEQRKEPKETTSTRCLTRSDEVFCLVQRGMRSSLASSISNNIIFFINGSNAGRSAVLLILFLQKQEKNVPCG